MVFPTSSEVIMTHQLERCIKEDSSVEIVNKTDTILPLANARTIVAEVGQAVAMWRDVSKAFGLKDSDIDRMASAFEHGDSVIASKLRG